jgi:hypothetical protein
MAASSWPHGSHNDLSGPALALILLRGGAVLGAIIGLVASLWRVRKPNHELWKPRVWSGITLGLAAGVVLHASSALPQAPTFVRIFEQGAVAIVLTAALGMLGGCITKIAGLAWDRHDVEQR